MAEPSQKCKEILRDIYDSEELKIDSNRCKAIAKTIEMLCTTGNSAFNDLYSEVCCVCTWGSAENQIYTEQTPCL